MTKGSRTRKIFVSYSREGGQAHAVSLFQGLTQVLGDKAVFLDVGRDAMEAGRSWKETVKKSLAKCDTLLLVFDPGMTARLADSESPVLFELETALKHNITIACVRVNGADIPAASALPQSLVDMPEWHSPEIHSDAAVADIERVIKELTGRVPGQVELVDRWDLVILAAIATIGLVAWFSLGDALNSSEKWLWGVSLIIPWLVWMTGRRALSFSNRGRSSLSYRQAASWFVVLAIVTIGWTFAKANIYRIPKFETDSGILVSRIRGDSNDQNQGQLLNSFSDSENTCLHIPVDDLPVRVGFSLLAGSLKTWEGHDQAHLLGIETGAAVVLWGGLPEPGQAKPRLSINLTFMESKSLFNRLGSKVVGAMNASELDTLDSNLDLLAEILPCFLEGYRRYHIAKSEIDFNWLEKEFLKIIKNLEKRPVKNSNERLVLDNILYTLHYFRGNTLLALGRREEAASEYKTAVSQTAKVVGEVNYIEAANNLGWLLKQEGKLDEAIATLTDVEHKCEGGDRKEQACAYAWYNLGGALSAQGKHQQASNNFTRAIDRIQNARDTSTVDWRLYGRSHQYLAYSLVRLAATSDASGKASLLERAQEAWQGGKAAFVKAGIDEPEYFQITLGRIQIERGEWSKSIQLLTSLDVPLEFQASVHALLAGAYWCDKKVKQAEKHLMALMASGIAGPASEGFRITNMEGMIEVGRIKKMCPST